MTRTLYSCNDRPAAALQHTERLLRGSQNTAQHSIAHWLCTTQAGTAAATALAGASPLVHAGVPDMGIALCCIVLRCNMQCAFALPMCPRQTLCWCVRPIQCENWNCIVPYCKQLCAAALPMSPPQTVQHHKHTCQGTAPTCMCSMSCLKPSLRRAGHAAGSFILAPKVWAR
jgi:hypothetical protein